MYLFGVDTNAKYETKFQQFPTLYPFCNEMNKIFIAWFVLDSMFSERTFVCVHFVALPYAES